MDLALDDVFLGREEIRDTLEKRVQAFLKGYRQNVSLIGARTIGKTSLVFHFLRTLQDPQLIPVYVAVSREPFVFFAQKFMGSLIAGFLRSQNEPVSVDFKDMIERSNRWIPKTLKKMSEVKKSFSKDDPCGSFRDLLALTDFLCEESGKKILLVLDNFDLLGEFGLRDPFRELGKAIMLQKNTLYFVVSSRIERSREILREKLSLLFGNFEVIELETFDFSTCDLFLARQVPGVRFSDVQKKFLFELTDGHPYFFSALIRDMREHLPPPSEELLPDGVLIDALERELYREDGGLYRYFLNLLCDLGRARNFHLSLRVLLAVALGHKKYHAIAKHIGEKAGDIKNTLSRLTEEEILAKKGSFFTFRLPLFSFWLRQVYQRKEWNFLLDLELPRTAFREEVFALIRKRGEEEKKELLKRMEELFRKFRNDVIEIDTKKLKCPHFTEVFFKPSNGRVFPVEAKSGSSRWICQVAYKKVIEEDVRLFTQDIGRLKSNVQKRILIALEGIELNAKILAKEANIMLWGLRNVNSLLDLYDSPKVVL
ncbi:MAG TPA: ATP-binding protein [Candidatus Omnitrophota bacterium]|nr:ATP-binding protein [Candidatus Omnitrophota bacterium]